MFQRFLSKARAKNQEYHPAVFIHIPETGGTTIENRMGFVNGSCHATATNLRNCNPLEYNKALKFTALHHPVDRAISLYRYACSGGNGQAMDREKYNWVKAVNFSAFVNAILLQEDVMFAPQQHYIMDHYKQSSHLVD